MPVASDDLHGNVPDESPVTLLLIDVINDLEYEGGDELLKYALPVAEWIAELKARAKRAHIPVVYVNDNFGKWKSDFNRLISHCVDEEVRGKPLVKLLKPDEDDYFVLKPKHSGFFATTLELLLKHLKSRTLILTGLTGNTCVLFTANDAYMREYSLIVPPDCVASIVEKENRYALELMQKVLKADLIPSNELSEERLRKMRDEPGDEKTS
jgi:nicotinamidase-related amidase